MSVYRAESCRIINTEQLEQDWHALQALADCSYFQSWGWLDTWLKQIAVDLEPVIIKVWHDQQLTGMGLFVNGQVQRHRMIRSKAMFLNEYPLEGKNMVIEYNGLLVARGHEKSVYEETARFLLNEFKQCDEFMFGAIAQGAGFDVLRKMQLNHARFLINESSMSWQVDLAGIPVSVDDFLAAMSKNRRTQIRRSMRLYEDQGALQIEEAESLEQALLFFKGLKTLHTQSWLEKDQPGSFANPAWEAFHLTLIQNRFSSGEIQLLKVMTGSMEIGYLYNFVWRDRVYVLQTGFNSSADKRLMPGYVTHVLAIIHNKVKGMSVYDLMHGDSLYKRMLCNHSQKIYWGVLQRRRLKFLLENVAVGMVRWLRGLLRPAD